MKKREILREDQVRAVDFIKKNQRCALWFDMSLGKTIITLTAIVDIKPKKVLIIAPINVAKGNWHTQSSGWEHTQHLTFSIMCGTEKERKHAFDQLADIYVINVENLIWLTKYIASIGKKWDYDFIVIDESSMFKSHSSKRVVLFMKLLHSLYKNGFNYRMVQLTGTPASNGYGDIYTQIYLLDFGERLGKNITAFRDKYMSSYRMPPICIYKEIKSLAPIVYDKVSDLVLIMSKKDAISLPSLNEIPVFVDIGSKMKNYLKLKNELYLEFGIKDDNELIFSESNNSLTVRSRLTQYASGTILTNQKTVQNIHDEKIESLREILEFCNSKVIVVYQFKADFEKLKQFFPQTLTMEKYNAIMEWCSGKYDIFIVSAQQIGHGIDGLQNVGDTIVWYTPIPSYELYSQMNSRLHRLGQQNNVSIYILLSMDTIDMSIYYNILQPKKISADAIFRGGYES